MFYISKLINSDTNIFEFNDNHLTQNDAIIFHETNSTIDKGVNLKGKFIKGRKFILQHISLTINQEENIHYILDGDLISLSFIIQGDINCKHELCDISLESGQVLLSKVVNYRLMGKLMLRHKSNYELINLQFHRIYLDKLLEEHMWLNHLPLFQNLLSVNTTGYFNYTIPHFNLKTFHLLLDIMDINTLPNHKSDYVELKFKELFLLLSTQTNDKTSLEYQEIHKIKTYIEQNYFEKLSLERIANYCNISQSTLKKKFKTEVGTTLHQYILNIKMAKAIRLLNKDFYVNELSDHLGFNSVSHFIKVFKKYYGYTPKEYLLVFQQKNPNN